MKSRVTILILFLIPVWGYGNTSGEGKDVIISSLTYHSNSEKELIANLNTKAEKDLIFYFIHSTPVELGKHEMHKLSDLQDLITKWKVEKYSSSNKELLQDIYYTIHRKFLKNYQIYSPFAGLFTNGKYDCLTGTALYAYILNKTGFDYQILESKYHMTLLVNDGENFYLLESTDPVSGLVLNQQKVNQRLKELQIENNPKNTYSFHFGINSRITLEEVNGLLYFNQAVKEYNSGKWLSSFNDLRKALLFYQSPRMQEFMGLILEEVKNSETIPQEQKEEMLNAYFYSIRSLASS